MSGFTDTHYIGLLCREWCDVLSVVLRRVRARVSVSPPCVRSGASRQAGLTTYSCSPSQAGK